MQVDFYSPVNETKQCFSVLVENFPQLLEKIICSQVITPGFSVQHTVLTVSKGLNLGF